MLQIFDEKTTFSFLNFNILLRKQLCEKIKDNFKSIDHHVETPALTHYMKGLSRLFSIENQRSIHISFETSLLFLLKLY